MQFAYESIFKNELNLLESNNKELLTKLMTEYIENVRIQSTLLNIISNSIFNSRQKSLNETNSLIDESFIKNFLYVFIVRCFLINSTTLFYPLHYS